MKCIVCSCTDEIACEGGCSWAVRLSKDRGVCSQCPIPVPESMLTRQQKKQRQALSSIIAKSDRRRMHSLNQLQLDQALLETAVANLRIFERKAFGR